MRRHGCTNLSARKIRGPQDDRRMLLLVLVGFLGAAFFWGSCRLLVFLLCFLRILRVLAAGIRRWGVRLLGVVGDVPARSLELDGGRGDHLFDWSAAFGARLDHLVGELLDFFEAMAALLALIFVKWHVM